MTKIKQPGRCGSGETFRESGALGACDFACIAHQEVLVIVANKVESYIAPNYIQCAVSIATKE